MSNNFPDERSSAKVNLPDGIFSTQPNCHMEIIRAASTPASSLSALTPASMAKMSVQDANFRFLARMSESAQESGIQPGAPPPIALTDCLAKNLEFREFHVVATFATNAPQDAYLELANGWFSGEKAEQQKLTAAYLLPCRNMMAAACGGPSFKSHGFEVTQLFEKTVLRQKLEPMYTEAFNFLDRLQQARNKVASIFHKVKQDANIKPQPGNLMDAICEVQKPLHEEWNRFTQPYVEVLEQYVKAQYAMANV